MKNKKFVLLVVSFLVLFFLVRLPGIYLPFHQDEWKNVNAASSVVSAGEFFAHPPLMQIILVLGYKIFGAGNYRFFPLLISLASAFLLYFVIERRSSKKEALWSLIIYLILFYGIFGALVPDVDGAILPFFFLLSVFFYDKWNATLSNFTTDHTQSSNQNRTKWKWFLLLCAALLAGFLTKLSFILVVGTIIADYILHNLHSFISKDAPRKIALLALSVGGFAAAYVGLLYFIRYTYPAFDMSIMLGHANQFSDGSGRNWIQIAVQGIKAVFYLSPLAFIPLAFISKNVFKKTHIFSLYLFLGAIFYFILFDFSRGALDKYLMFAIVPLSVIVGSIFAEILKVGENISRKRWLIVPLSVGVFVGVILFAFNFIPSEVLPLYPKTLWFSRILHGKWAILNPFNGGSGPLGFYISFLFIAAAFVVSAAIAVLGFIKKEWRAGAAIILLCIGILYNAVFAEELFFGKINGSAPQVLAKSIEFIRGRSDIKKVITYNDIGAASLETMGKYTGRIYATPQSEDVYKAIFSKHVADGGHFLVVGIPPLGADTFYGKFFAGCDSLYETTSGRIRSDVYVCNLAKYKK